MRNRVTFGQDLDREATFSLKRAIAIRHQNTMHLLCAFPHLKDGSLPRCTQTPWICFELFIMRRKGKFVVEASVIIIIKLTIDLKDLL